jgi:hypothetical protein
MYLLESTVFSKYLWKIEIDINEIEKYRNTHKIIET